MKAETKTKVTTATSVVLVAGVVAAVMYGSLTLTNPTPEPSPTPTNTRLMTLSDVPTDLQREAEQDAAEAEAARVEEARLAAEAEANRLAAEAEADRIAAEQEAQRIQQEQAENEPDAPVTRQNTPQAPAPQPEPAPAPPPPPAPAVMCPAGSSATSSDGYNDTGCLPDICFSIMLPDPAHPECDEPFRP